MKFVQENSSILCIRSTKHDNDSYDEVVATFDARQTAIPPHVLGRLGSSEVRQLSLWLKERKQLQHRLNSGSEKEVLIETLPFVLREVNKSITQLDSVDRETVKAARAELVKLHQTLAEVDKTESTAKNVNEFNHLSGKDISSAHFRSLVNKSKEETPELLVSRYLA